MKAITPQQLKVIAPFATQANINKYMGPLNATFEKYDISTPLRQAHFLAQVLHESGSLKYCEELASGDAYEGRRDLGNLIKGDGKRFKGRGLIQLTGRANYRIYGKAIGVDLEAKPELVATLYAVDVAGWYWNSRKLNELADKDDAKAVTKKVNGGYNGLEDRLKYLQRAKQTLLV